jgi:ribosomal protein S27E
LRPRPTQGLLPCPPPHGRGARAPPFLDPPGYARHRPEATLLYQLVEQHYPAFSALRSEAGRPLPDYIEQEFDAYLKCGRLEEGFLRLRCDGCHAEKLVAFSCKMRGFCPSCGARRMAETAALLADEALPERPLRQWVLSLPHALRFLPAANPAALTQVLGVVNLAISGYLLKIVGLTRATGHTRAVTLVQRFGSALNLNIRSSRASRSRRSSPESSRIWKRPLPISTRPSCRAARGHRRRRPTCFSRRLRGRKICSTTRT